jgi:SAM-dependent methyltransferase
MDAEHMHVFDRSRVAIARGRKIPGDFDFLHDRVTADIAERLRDVRREFPQALRIGARGKDNGLKDTARYETITIMDAAGNADICGDEENLPFAPHSFDLIVNPLTLHAVNDLPGALIQLRRALKPDGLFIGALFGGDTLHELRASLMQAEMNVSGGVSPRVAPMAGRQALAALMQRAGFALPVVDAETVTVIYNDIMHLMRDLRGMGETNSLAARRRTMTGRALFIEAERIYRENYGSSDGKIPATFEIIYLNGWAPHESQQKPLRRGSAEHSLTDALGC